MSSRAPASTMADARLEASLDQGFTLPATWYTSPPVFALEKERVFHRCWQYVGLTERVARHGDYLTYQAGDVPILVVRDAGDRLRGFVNVCRHRGSQLVLDDCGRRKSIQCHYHAWTYGLDGSLLAAPGSNAEPGFDRSAFVLAPVQVDTWGPFIFVNPDPSAPPLAEILGELPALVRQTGVNLDALHCRHRDRYHIAANWKVVVDNYLECYHCPVAHPGFSALIDLDDYTIQEYDLFSTQTGGLKESAGSGKRQPYDVVGEVDVGFYVYLWPTFMLNIYPGAGNVSLNLILPRDTGETEAVYEFCFLDAVSDGEAREFVGFIDQVQREDTVLCESVQRGLRSGFFDQGRLLLTRERALRHFQKLVYRFLSA